MSQERLGLLFAGLCAVNGAFVPAIAKLTTNQADAFLVAAVTTIFAGICATALLAVRRDLHYLTDAETRYPLLAVGTLGTGVAFLLFYSGASRATAIDTVICLQTEPAYSLLLSWIFLGHRPGLRRCLAIVVLLLGIGLAVGARGVSGSLGVWLLLATPLCWQTSHLIVFRRLVGVPPHVITGARYTYGNVVLCLAWLVGGGLSSLPQADAWRTLLPLLALQGMVLSFGGTLLWYNAIIRLDLTRGTAIVVPSIPLLSLVTSFLLLGEVPTVLQALGLLLTATGVIAFVTAPAATVTQRRDPLAPSTLVPNSTETESANRLRKTG